MADLVTLTPYRKAESKKDITIRQQKKQIKELERKLEQTEKDLANYQFNYPKIKELEKENEELRKNGFTVSAMTEQQLKVALEKGERLEKENAELKEWQKDTIKARGNDYMDWSRMKDQLTKAKDHIKKLLDCLKQDTNDPQTNYYVCQYMDKAEQFLKEIGND